MRFSVITITAAVVAAVSLLTTGTRPGDAAEAVLRPPTDAPVLDPFRLPDGPYGAGNRGIEYGTADGAEIRAAAAGRVVFSGAVAGSLFVTVDHGGGLESTYGFVSHLLVDEGDEVAAGTPVARAGGPFHFGVRLHGRYVDPASLIGTRVVRVRLVAHHRDRPDPAGSSALGAERLAALEWARHERLEEVGAALWRRITVVVLERPATLHDGSNGPRTASRRRRRNHFSRATPGRFGVGHGCPTGNEDNDGSHLHEAAAGGRSAFRPPDPPLEPQDEAVHPRRAVRHPHRGSPSDAQPSRAVVHLRA